jgi:hypothetical protein
MRHRDRNDQRGDHLNPLAQYDATIEQAHEQRAGCASGITHQPADDRRTNPFR